MWQLAGSTRILFCVLTDILLPVPHRQRSPRRKHPDSRLFYFYNNSRSYRHYFSLADIAQGDIATNHQPFSGFRNYHTTTDHPFQSHIAHHTAAYSFRCVNVLSTLCCRVLYEESQCIIAPAHIKYMPRIMPRFPFIKGKKLFFWWFIFIHTLDTNQIRRYIP